MHTASLFANCEVCPRWSLPRRTAAAGHGAPRGIAAKARSIRERIALWVERARQRRALATLDDHMLRDLGITRVEAERECGKPFWR